MVASHSGTGVPILFYCFYCGQDGIDQRLRIEALVAIPKVATLEQRGREYLEAMQPNRFGLKLSSRSRSRKSDIEPCVSGGRNITLTYIKGILTA